MIGRVSLEAACLAPAAALAGQAISAPVTVPFDFSKSAIGLDVTVGGTPLYVIVDTGVDPSLIDLARADALGLKVDRSDGGEASGFGEGKGASVFPTTVSGVVIQGRAFAPFDALASDMSALSARYGRKLDGVFGYSFLSDKIVLIDYSGAKLGILDKPGDARQAVRTCQTHWTTPLTTADNIPVIPRFRFGAAAGPITIDTGSNGGIGLYRNALDLPGMHAALIEHGTVTHSGAKGDARAQAYILATPVGFGPFTLPAGQHVIVHSGPAPADGPVANIGNALFAAMKIRMLLDYRGRTMTFYGDCR